MMSEVMEGRVLSTPPPQHTTSPWERTAQKEEPEEVKKATGGVPACREEGGGGEAALPQHTTPQDALIPQAPGVGFPWVRATMRSLVLACRGGENAGPPQVTVPSSDREHQDPPPPTNTPLDDVPLPNTTLGEVESPPQHVTRPTLSNAQG